MNKDKTAYEAILAPLGKSGKYRMNIIVLDYKNQGLKKLEGSLKALVFEAGARLTQGPRSYRMLSILAFIIILLLLILAVRRKSENKHRNEAY